MRSSLRRLHRHVVPHHENAGRPAFFVWENLARFAMAVFLLVTIVGGARNLLRGTGIGAAVIASDVLEIENAARAEARLPKLRINEDLSRAARAKAEDMIRRGYFAHEGPKGEQPWEFMDNSNYGYVYAGENLALDFGESPDVVTAWLNSPAHRENVLGVQFRETGIAVVEGEYEGRPRLFVVQMFGARGVDTPLVPSRPLSSRPEWEKSEETPSAPVVLGARVTSEAVKQSVSLIESLPNSIIPALLVCMLMIAYSLYHFTHGPHTHRYYALQAAAVLLFMVGAVTVIAPSIRKDTKLPAETVSASTGEAL